MAVFLPGEVILALDHNEESLYMTLLVQSFHRIAVQRETVQLVYLCLFKSMYPFPIGAIATFLVLQDR